MSTVTIACGVPGGLHFTINGFAPITINGPPRAQAGPTDTAYRRRSRMPGLTQVDGAAWEIWRQNNRRNPIVANRQVWAPDADELARLTPIKAA
jgi:hypothetical protein